MNRKDWIKYSLIGVVLFVLVLGVAFFVAGNVNIFEWDSFDRAGVVMLWCIAYGFFFLMKDYGED